MKFFFIGLFIAAVAAGAYYFFFPKEQQEKVENTQSTMQTMPNELIIENIAVGEGKEAIIGSTVFVHYTGTLQNGIKFDSSLDRGQPFSFTLGNNQVIQGWEQGILGMKAGGKRKLTIPPDLGYGQTGAGDVIPPNATLLFEVELLEVK